MKLFGAVISPFVRKVAVVAAEKGIGFTWARGGPGSDNPEFLAASPFGKIPAIEDDGFTLCDSSAIVWYLEAKQPDPVLIPADPQTRGRVVWFDEFADTILATAGLKILFNRVVGPHILKVGGDEALALQGEAELPRSLDYIEQVCAGREWLAGEAFSLADISVASMLRTLRYVRHGPDAAVRPATAAWYDRVCARPGWQQIAAGETAFAARIMPPDLLA